MATATRTERRASSSISSFGRTVDKPRGQNTLQTRRVCVHTAYLRRSEIIKPPLDRRECQWIDVDDTKSTIFVKVYFQVGGIYPSRRMPFKNYWASIER